MGAPLNHGSSLSVKSQVPADLSPDRQMSSTKGLAVDEGPGEDDFDNSIEHPRFVKEPFKDGLELLDEDMGLHRVGSSSCYPEPVSSCISVTQGASLMIFYQIKVREKHTLRCHIVGSGKLQNKLARVTIGGLVQALSLFIASVFRIV